jgi:NADH:ubiquinone oxidoreductase subunit 3 (subunit A)
LPLHSYRLLFFVLIGEPVLLLFCAWAIHFKANLPVGRARFNEMVFFALAFFFGLFYLWCKGERG